MTTTLQPQAQTTTTPTDRLLTATLVIAPLVYLAADTTYAARGWDSASGGVLHVLGATLYGFVVLRVASWVPRETWLRALVLFTGTVGLAGNVAYGFDAIHTSLGDVELVAQPGAANLIKPYGLFFPLSLLLIALAVKRLGRQWQAAVILVAALGWPVAHIGDIAPLAVAVNLLLVVGVGGLAWSRATGSVPDLL